MINTHDKATSFIKNNIVADLQLGMEPEIISNEKWEILNRFHAAGVTHLSAAIATDATSIESTMQFLADFRARIASSPSFVLGDSLSAIHDAKAKQKLAITFLLQGPNPLGKSLNMLDLYYQLGVRSLILAYNIRNPFADGCAEPFDAGLSRLGKQLISKMNAIGMLIDCSHTGYRSSMDAMDASTQPVIFSHSNVAALFNHPRNLKDDQIKALAKTGGVIGINGNGALLGAAKATTEKYVEHIDYIANLVGADHVSLGTDLVYFPESLEDYMQRLAIFYSDAYRQSVTPKHDAAIYPEALVTIVEALMKRGYDDCAIKGILGENYLRVIAKVWR